MPPSHSFTVTSLPIELQGSIIRYLDPIALISLSQTNRHFRTLIDPTRTHFVERLLALECRASEGGPQIHFSRFGTLDPDRNSPEWAANRWACTGCLRLLHFYAFNNQMLSSIGYRKPIPRSRIAERCTSWEPSGCKVKTRGTAAKEDAIQPGYLHKDRTLRRRYGITTTQNWGVRRRGPGGDIMQPQGAAADQELMDRFLGFQDCGMAEFVRMQFAEFERLSDSAESEIFDRDAHAVEILRAGSNRHVRRCIECRFQRGEFIGCAGQGKGIGTVNVPIVVGRRKWYGTLVDRYFPDISYVLHNKRPDVNVPVYAPHRSDPFDMPWTLYRARCPACEKWKELRAFRVGGLWPRWKPASVGIENAAIPEEPYANWDGTDITEDLLNTLQCNYCFAQEHGFKGLGDELVRWLAYLVDVDLQNMGNYLLLGLREQSYGMDILHLPYPSYNAANLSPTDVAFMRQQRDEWLADAGGNLNPESSGLNSRHTERLKFFNEAEVMWYWLKACAEEIEETGKGYVLAEWALRRNEAVES
ncbi:hypothetical protein BDV10DRAFT_199806 [Aspergillus recurvatus]